MDNLLPKTPENYGQLLKRGLKLYFASFSKFFLFALLLAIVVFIPRFLSDIIEQDIFLNLPPFSLHRLWLIVIDFAAIVFFIAIIWRMHCVIRKRHEPLSEDLLVGIKKGFYALVATLIQSAIIFAVTLIIYGLQLLLYQYHLLFTTHVVGTIITFMIFVGQFMVILYVATLFLFLIPLITIENQGILSSLERSVTLVWNHWWRVFSLQLTPWISYVLLLIVIKHVMGINVHIYFTEHGGHSLTSTAINLFIFALFIPWSAALLLVQLKDLELRKNTS